MRHLVPRGLVAAALAVGGCEGGATAPGAAADAPGEPGADAAGTDAAAGGAVVQIGVNPVGVQTPQAFHLLEPGDEVLVEWGFQGFQMIVLAARTDQPGTEPIWMSSTFTLDGEVVASARIRDAGLEPGGDGWYYAFDHFVITAEPDPWLAKDLELTVALEDDGGAVLGEASVTVHAALAP